MDIEERDSHCSDHRQDHDSDKKSGYKKKRHEKIAALCKNEAYFSAATGAVANLAGLILTPGPMVVATTQERTY